MIICELLPKRRWQPGCGCQLLFQQRIREHNSAAGRMAWDPEPNL